MYLKDSLILENSDSALFLSVMCHLISLQLKADWISVLNVNDMTSARTHSSVIRLSFVNAFIMRALATQGLFEMDREKDRKGWRVLENKK